MANKTRRILFETIADAALRQAVKLAGIAGTVCWNEKPENRGIFPDFTIGLMKGEPRYVVLSQSIVISAKRPHPQFGLSVRDG